MSQALRFTFPQTLRVTRGADFDRAYRLKHRRDEGCVVVYAAPNGGPLPRLGLSVSRRVGNAAVRNRLKRLLREAFRLEQARMPVGCDLVVVVRPHGPRALDSYREILVRCAESLGRSGTGS